MNFVNNTSNKEINIEITPLIDIVFLLVIFFVVTSKIDSSQAIDIDLPNTSSFMNQSQLSSNTIFLYENGSLIYKDLTLTINEVEPLMNFIANNISNKEKIILAVEKKEKYERKRNGWPMQNTSTRCRYFGLSPKFVISPLFLLHAREIPARVCSPRRT